MPKKITRKNKSGIKPEIKKKVLSESKPKANTALSILHWAPRILAILYVLFLGLFSLDVFGNGDPLSKVVLAFLIHNIPSLLMLLLLWICWRYAWQGGIVFVLLGLFYIFAAPAEHISSYLLIAGPAILTGTLFIIDDVLRRNRDKQNEA